jgi:hypothetical protein
MSTIQINLDAMTPSQRASMAKLSPELRTLVLDFERANSAADVAYSNQSTFDFNGEQVSLKTIALIAYSNLASEADKTWTNTKTGKVITKEGTPALYAYQSPAWDILRRVQAGKVAQGLEFSLEWKDLRLALEAM